jgi:hypothetical protein
VGPGGGGGGAVGAGSVPAPGGGRHLRGGDPGEGLRPDGDPVPVPPGALGPHSDGERVVESAFAALRLRTDAAKRFKRSDRATAVIWKMLLVAEQRFRRLNAPHLLAKVYAGVRYVDGVEATQEVAA